MANIAHGFPKISIECFRKKNHLPAQYFHRFALSLCLSFYGSLTLLLLCRARALPDAYKDTRLEELNGRTMVLLAFIFRLLLLFAIENFVICCRFLQLEYHEHTFCLLAFKHLYTFVFASENQLTCPLTTTRWPEDEVEGVRR